MSHHTKELRASATAHLYAGHVEEKDFRVMGVAYGWEGKTEYDDTGSIVSTPEPSPEAMANAKLWAAAPELVEALARLRNECDLDGLRTKAGFDCWLSVADAALAKAGAA